MNARDIIVIGASAGGVQAVSELAKYLPEQLSAAIFVVVHSSPESPGILPQIIARAGKLPAKHVVNGAVIEPGHIYVSRPDYHVLIEDGRMRLSHGPKENGFRPAVDPLFRSAARAHGRRVIGVLLSGGLDDGTEGLGVIKQMGGIAIAQDPNEATFPSMPSSAIQHVEVDYVLPVQKIARTLVRLTKKPRSKGDAAMPAGANKDVAEEGDSGMTLHDRLGPPSAFTCPECGGALWELDPGGVLQFRCHVGHVYTGQGLVSEQARELEAALWTAVRALEGAGLKRRMSARAHDRKMTSMALQYEQQAMEAEGRAGMIRKILTVSEMEKGRGVKRAKGSAGAARGRGKKKAGQGRDIRS